MATKATARKYECRARQYSDQMSCHLCGLAWDVNDQDPPTCGKVSAKRNATREAYSKAMRVLRDLLSKNPTSRGGGAS